MREVYLGLKLAFSYFSIFPVRFKDSNDLNSQKVLRYMILLFPFVGFVLGFLTIEVYKLIDYDIPYVSCVAASLGYMIFYGFIHTEAVVDVVDAIYAKMSGKDPYKIIKEPTVGALGVLWGVCVVIIKVSLVSYMLYRSLYYEFLSVVVISRMVLVMMIKYADFKSSFVNSLKKSLESSSFYPVMSVFLLFGIWLDGFGFISLLVLGVVFGAVLFMVIKDKLGFANGDVLGFSLELTEIVLFFAVLFETGRETVWLLPS